MSVSAVNSTARLITLKPSSFELPSHIWLSSMQLACDATGGTATLAQQFTNKAQLISIEGMHFQSTDIAANRLLSIGWEDGYTVAGLWHGLRVASQLKACIGYSWLDIDRNVAAFLKQCMIGRVTDQNVSLIIQTENISGANLVLTAWGYVWDLRAEIEGIPRRP